MSSTDDPPFTRIVIVGLGLIGGSIALGLRERWPAVHIVGVDRPPVLAHALSSGAIDRAAERMAIAGEADLVVLAAPVRQNLELLAEAAAVVAAARDPLLITDVGGTKRDIVAAGAALPRHVAFVGGHPIGGAERGGFGFARADLFKGRPWLFTPAPATPASSLEPLYVLARGVGARPSALAADEHDRLMANLSHLPQLAASALMDIVGEAAAADGLRLAGRGLVDTTRLASSPASIWRDICAANADEIGSALDRLIIRLQELRDGLRDGRRIDQVFEDAGRWRAELMKGRE